MTDLTGIVKNLGLSDKAAKIYIAAMALGEASVQQLAETSKLKRTSLYYILDGLIDSGVLIAAKTGKKIRYIPEQPETLLKIIKERVSNFENSVQALEQTAGHTNRKPRVYFLFGPAGFKQVWDMILKTKEKEFRIITEGENFLDYAKEKYILDEIITKKKKLGVRSKQLITDSQYAKSIVAKDIRENRVSKFLPDIYKLPFTEIITESIVAFISPRFSNMIFIVENDAFSKTRKSIFESLWQSLR
ncbi:MAG: hypothetical protein HY226_04785 [Candidatus Vogelbacteria bacterium]|nr:hypothetical protein [Candidatus Vogelbacteria bacterium]